MKFQVDQKVWVWCLVACGGPQDKLWQWRHATYLGFDMGHEVRLTGWGTTRNIVRNEAILTEEEYTARLLTL